MSSSTPKASKPEISVFENLDKLLKENPLKDELISNLPLFNSRQVFMRQLFFYELYQKILNTHGVIMEFGCRWGTNLSTLISIRGILEPYNHNRTIVGFDTFQGLSGVSAKDYDGSLVQEGAYKTSKNYKQYLEKILENLEFLCPINHIKKHKIIEGDVKSTFPNYIKDNPQTVVALVYLDMDIYEPTKFVLDNIKPYLTKGSIVVFDEMNWKEFPGPTIALKEIFGLAKYKIYRSPLQPIPGYIIID